MTLFLTARSPKITVCRKIGVTKGATRVIRSIFGEPERLNPTDYVEGGREGGREGMIIGAERAFCCLIPRSTGANRIL